MWRTDTLWLDVAVVAALFAVGNICFGRFVEHQPRWRRVLKLIVTLAITVGLSATAGRPWAYGVLAIPLFGVVYVHAWWLPRHGVSGWTAEPRARYLELVGATRSSGDAAAPTTDPRDAVR